MQSQCNHKRWIFRDFPKLMAQLIAALDKEPRDILGPLYMELEIANKDAGQFFTPPELSELMAQMTFVQELDKLETQAFITAGEPAAGAGGMILALVKVMITAGHNPADKLWVQAIDVDRMATLMCYIQLSLWNVPAEVIVGNTLSLEFRDVWYTPAHHLGLWKYRLRRLVVRWYLSRHGWRAKMTANPFSFRSSKLERAPDGALFLRFIPMTVQPMIFGCPPSQVLMADQRRRLLFS